MVLFRRKVILKANVSSANPSVVGADYLLQQTGTKLETDRHQITKLAFFTITDVNCSNHVVVLWKSIKVQFSV